MQIRLSVITLISLTLILTGVMLMEGTRGNTMAMTEHPEAANTVLPPIDKDFPAVIETATFALG